MNLFGMKGEGWGDGWGWIGDRIWNRGRFRRTFIPYSLSNAKDFISSKLEEKGNEYPQWVTAGPPQRPKGS